MSSPTQVYLVSVGGGVAQVFANLKDAMSFTSENPGARTTRHLVRQSMDEAVVVHDRRVIVAHGSTVRDCTDVLSEFVDDLGGAPGSAAEVEWFYDTSDFGWHIVGFGTDRRAVDAQVELAVDRFRRLGHGAAAEPVGAFS